MIIFLGFMPIIIYGHLEPNGIVVPVADSPLLRSIVALTQIFTTPDITVSSTAQWADCARRGLVHGLKYVAAGAFPRPLTLAV